MDQRKIMIESASIMADKANCGRIFVFLDTTQDCRWIVKSGLLRDKRIYLVLPTSLETDERFFEKSGSRVLRNWSGNQSRFSRIKYAFLQGVL